MARKRKIAGNLIIAAAALVCMNSFILKAACVYAGVILESTPETVSVVKHENSEASQGENKQKANISHKNDAQNAAPQQIYEVTETTDSNSGETEKQKIYLDADNLSYGEYDGVAIAEGSVKIRNKNTSLFAPYAEFDSKSNTVDAYSDYRENVVINSAGGTLMGKHLKYNMETGRGVLTQASGKVDQLYVQGNTVKVMPAEDAVKEGLIKDKKGKSKENGKNKKKVAEWLEVTSTTCDFTKPHYRLVSKKVIVYPGQKTVIKQPKLYIGNTMVMKYPFDFVAANKKSNTQLIPIIKYDSKKGAGIGIRGPIDLDDFGMLDLGAVYWTQDIWEMSAEYKYTVAKGLEIFGTVDRSYNSDAPENESTLWRPTWGVKYENNGWNAKLWWAQREKVGNEIFPDYNVDFDVWRDPEFALSTPWFKEHLTNGEIRFFGLWGRYSDNIHTEYVERLAYGAEYNARPNWNWGVFKPFYGGRYTEYKYYENDNTSQQVTNAWVGFDYSLGQFDMQSAFAWQWGDEGSPMMWDKYGDRKIFYQKISFPLPFGASWEKWNLSLLGRYDVGGDKFSSLKCVLTYNKHCMSWELWFGQNFTKDETKIGLTFYLNAYPQYRIGVGEEQTSDKNQGNADKFNFDR
ncbi:MAG: hypothetical protein Q4E17_03825 [Synergistes sp.]|nr:hypothetical protein [Synergistes sp.]